MHATLTALLLLAQPADPLPGYVDVRSAPLLDLYFSVRALADADDPAPPDLAAAVEAARAFSADTRSLFAWGLIDGTLITCNSAADFARACEALPEHRTLPGRGDVPVRAPALRLAEALQAAEPHYVSTSWQSGHARLVAARSAVQAALQPKSAEVFSFLRTHLRLPEPSTPIPVYLVSAAPYPGGFTFRTPQGPACVVDAGRFDGLTLVEAVLHECIHALDALPTAAPSVLAELRAALQSAGVPANDARMRDIPHTLIFAHAAGTVRAVLDPTHRDAGETLGYYERVGAMAAAVRHVWSQHLTGQGQSGDIIASLTTAAAP